MNSDSFQLEGGSGLGGPSHYFYGVGGIREGSPDSIHCLTHSVESQGENHLIGQVKGEHWAGPLCLWGIGCGGGMINGYQEMGVARG